MRKVVKLDELSPEEDALTPRYAQRALTEAIPKYELGENGMDPDSAYQLIHDELLLDGSSGRTGPALGGWSSGGADLVHFRGDPK